MDSGIATVSAESYNEMKKELEASKRISQELCASLRLWKDKCESLGKDLKRTQVNMECVQNQMTKTVSRSSSTTASKSKGIRNAKEVRDIISKEMGEKDVPTGVQGYVKKFVDNMSRYAQQFSNEVCESCGEDMISELDWAPNYVFQEDGRQRDWRGRSIELKVFRQTVLQDDMDLHETGCPMPVMKVGNEGGYVVKALFFPLCPIDESSKGTLYTSTPEALSNFVGQSAVHVLRNSLEEMPSLELERSVFQYTSQNSSIVRRFDIVCRQAIAGKKKQAKSVFFCYLGYPTITAVRPRTGIEDFEKKKTEEMEEAYKKLYKQLPCGTRDTCWWRKAKFDEICSDSCPTIPLEQNGCVDLLFQNQAAREAMVEFRRLQLNPRDCSSILTLSRLDAIMNSIIDLFQDNTAMERNDYHSTSKENQRRTRKGGTVPNESSRRFKILLPTATSNLLNEVLSAFQEHLLNDKASMEFELAVGRSGDDITRLRNKQREFTTAFKHPLNNHYFIALRKQAFTSIICGWLGGVIDCVILHSTTIDGPFSGFNDEVAVDIRNESDEDSVYNEHNAMERGTASSLFQEEEESEDE